MNPLMDPFTTAPHECCEAQTADCIACEKGVSKAEVCAADDTLPGCEREGSAAPCDKQSVLDALAELGDGPVSIDFNGDGMTDKHDHKMLLKAYGGGKRRCGDAGTCKFDLNFDGVVDGCDVMVFTLVRGNNAERPELQCPELGPLPDPGTPWMVDKADLNGDGVVNAADVAFLTHLLRPTGGFCDNQMCPEDDVCSDGRGRRAIGDNCCACPEEACAMAMCSKDLCYDGEARRIIGDECCACPEDHCALARCSADLCGDGEHRRLIGDDCCGCPEESCATVMCGGELCWDGGGPRPIGSDCCACPDFEPLVDVVVAGIGADCNGITPSDANEIDEKALFGRGSPTST